jgi:DNA modification methylase
VIIVGDVRQSLATPENGSVQMVATSPPYWAPPKGKARGGLRKYGDASAEIGAEPTLDLYCASIVSVMAQCWRVLRDDGTAWVNLGDSYDGSANMVPFEAARALRKAGWVVRAIVPWVKVGSAMPESVQSRPCIAHEYVLFLTKRPSGYFYDADAVRMGQSPRSDVSHVNSRLNGAKEATTQTGGKASNTLGRANPAGRSFRSSDFWRAGALDLAEQLQAAAAGQAIGMLTNDDAPAAFIVNPKGSGIPHFAMWPTRLVAPMIMAGTPEAGSCSACNAPWMRVVETERLQPATPSGMRETGRWSGKQESDIGGRLRRASLGFRPSCDHDAPAVPAVVLDPFAGAFTTIGVAEALGRVGVGCELYQANADLAPTRIAIVKREVAEYLRERSQGEKAAALEADTKGQGDLFSGFGSRP